MDKNYLLVKLIFKMSQYCLIFNIGLFNFTALLFYKWIRGITKLYICIDKGFNTSWFDITIICRIYRIRICDFITGLVSIESYIFYFHTNCVKISNKCLKFTFTRHFFIHTSTTNLLLNFFKALFNYTNNFNFFLNFFLNSWISLVRK